MNRDNFKDREKAVQQNSYLNIPGSLQNYISNLNAKSIFWSWVGSFLGILTLAKLHDFIQIISSGDFIMLIGSFGASAVLAYGAIDSPLAQPKNIIGGHIISAIIGVAIFKLFGDQLWFASALAVSLSIVAMQLTGTLHPPGGATALIAVTGGPLVHSLGYSYAILPVGIGATIIVIIATIVNNIPKDRVYPNQR